MRRRLGEVLRARRPHGDAGLTLAELLVSMFLISIVMTVLVSMFVSFSRTYTEDRASTDSANLASAGMVELTRVIRAGTEIRVANAPNLPVFTVAENERMVLHAYIDTDSTTPRPVKIEFRIVPQPDGNRELVETRCPAVASSGPNWTFQTGAACRTKLVSRHISTRTGTQPWLFGYVNADGAAMTVPAGGFTADQRRTIGRVSINLQVQSDVTSRALPVVMRATVGIPNLGIDRVGAGA